MTGNTNELHKPKRRWFQFRLRTLVLLLLSVGIALGWWHQRQTFFAQREEIRRLQAQRDYWRFLQLRRYLMPAQDFDFHEQSFEWPLTVGVAGSNNNLYLLNEYANLMHETRQVASAETGHIASRVLNPAGEWVTPGHVKSLEVHEAALVMEMSPWLKQALWLEELALKYPTATAADLDRLADEGLVVLNVDGSQFGDADMDCIARYQNLRAVVLSRTRVTGESLGKLTALPKLQHLNLDGCSISDAGMQVIGDLPTSIELSLANLQVSDAAVKRFVRAHPGASYVRPHLLDTAMRWVIAQQRSDGGWSLTGPYPDGALEENDCLATSMAVLALKNTGQEWKSAPKQQSIERGLAFLLAHASAGEFTQHDTPGDRLLTQALATFALVEVLSETDDGGPERATAELALAVCESMLQERLPKERPAAVGAVFDSGELMAILALSVAQRRRFEVNTSALADVRSWLELEDAVPFTENPQPRSPEEWKALARLVSMGEISPNKHARLRRSRQADALLDEGRRVSELLQRGEHGAEPFVYSGANVEFWQRVSSLRHSKNPRTTEDWVQLPLRENFHFYGPLGGSWDPGTNDAPTERHLLGRLYVTCANMFTARYDLTGR